MVEWLIVPARNRHANERLILDIRRLGNERSEGDTFVDVAIDMAHLFRFTSMTWPSSAASLPIR